LGKRAPVEPENGEGMMRRILGGFLFVAFALILGRLGSEFRFEANSLPPLDSLVALTRQAESEVTESERSDPSPAPPTYLSNPLRYLSEAPIDSLQLLPGIGPVLAERLASARSGRSLFTRWEELLGVKGIGPKKLQRLRELAGESGANAVDRR
jgi:predicted flap endonuclease-1-like 5' DNA nuclease